MGSIRVSNISPNSGSLHLSTVIPSSSTASSAISWGLRSWMCWIIPNHNLAANQAKALPQTLVMHVPLLDAALYSVVASVQLEHVSILMLLLLTAMSVKAGAAAAHGCNVCTDDESPDCHQGKADDILGQQDGLCGADQ